MAPIKESHKRPRTRFGRSLQNTSLMFQALENGDVPTMNRLLKEGGLRINARSHELMETLLMVAVVYGRCIRVIQRLVRAGCLINSADVAGETALHKAARYHKIHIAIELIRLGADVRARNNEGETPLQLAVANKSHVDVLNEMIPNGARLREMDFHGLESLSAATTDWNPRDWITDLVASYEGKTIYNEELRRLVKMLLDAGADVNAREALNGCSPIQCAVYTGDLQLVQVLIDAGADLNNRNDLGISVLHDAVFCCNKAMVHLLLSRGADVKVETIEKTTALHWAVELNIDNSHKEIIKKLVEFDCDIYHKSFGDSTPFQDILQHCDVELVTFLVDEHKADLNKLHSRWGNALVFAAQNEDERVMDLVLQRSAELEIDYRCNYKLTALHEASRLSLLGNVRRLISRGADVNAKDILDQTPLIHCVCMMGANVERVNFADERLQVIRLLLEYETNVNNLANMYEERKKTVLEVAIAMMNDNDEAWKVIIEYAAEFEARTNQPLFDGHNLRVIEKNPEVESYYRKCRAELTTMRMTKIEGCSISYLSVLTQQLDVVARYTRNDELVENLQLTLQRDAYPIYARQLKKRFNEATSRRIRIDRAFTVLSETMQCADLTDSILDNIVKHLNEHDIEVLIGSA